MQVMFPSNYHIFVGFLEDWRLWKARTSNFKLGVCQVLISRVIGMWPDCESRTSRSLVSQLALRGALRRHFPSCGVFGFEPLRDGKDLPISFLIALDD
jgi:hypothetical protein